jgi:hypothetical protein
MSKAKEESWGKAPDLPGSHPDVPAATSGAAPGGAPPASPEGLRVQALIVEAAALGFDLVPRRPAVGNPAAEEIDRRTKEAQKALAEHKGDPLPAEGAGTYLVTFPGEAPTAVDAKDREEAIAKAKAQLGIISSASPPVLARAK